MIRLLRRVGICAALAAATSAAPGGAQGSAAPSASDWQRDLDRIVADIRLLHPDPFTVRGRYAFLRDVEALETSLPKLTQEQRVVALMRIVASLGDGHTWLEPDSPAFASWYPVRFYDFPDGVFITSAHESVADLAGAEVLAIAGKPANVVLDDTRALMAADNASGRKERLWAVHNAALMKGLGYAGANGELIVRLRLPNGRTVERTLLPSRTNHPRFRKDDATFEWTFRPETYGLPFGADSQWVTAFRGLRASAFATSDTTRPLFLMDRRPYAARALPARDAYYIRNHYVTDTDFIPFFQRALGEIDQQKPRRLIVDWRFNFGGDGSKLQYLVREFVKRADNRPWKELYILTGPKTFSAAIMAIDALLDNVTATVVGEPSAAGLNHFGDPTARPYPRTGVRLNVSTLRHQLGSSDDLREFVPVDVPAPLTFADYAAGRDAAVDAILRGDDMRGVPQIALADGGGAARRVYTDRVHRLSKYAWWAPPKEYDMRQSCDLLQEQKRFVDAVETCRLNADIHPNVWNVWYNLAVAQRNAGMMKERLASYRCVLAIAPDNWNVPAIQRLLAQPGNEGSEVAPGCPVP